MANDGKNIVRFLFLLLVLVNCQTFIACQEKLESIAETLKQCQQLLDKDDVIAANECYLRARITHPESVAKVIETNKNLLVDKCVEFSDKKIYVKAVICFEGLAILLPDRPSVFIYLADSNHKLYKELTPKRGELLDFAEEAIKKAIKLRPESAIAHADYGRILEQKGDLRGALREHQEAVRLEPKDDLYLMRLGILQDKLGDTNEAIKSYEQVLRLNPEDTLALYFVGKLYEKAERNDDAIESYEKLLKIKSEYDDAKQRLEALKKQQREPKQQNQKPEESKTKAVGKQ